MFVFSALNHIGWQPRRIDAKTTRYKPVHPLASSVPRAENVLTGWFPTQIINSGAL
jgi:hypothetical protein